MSSISSIAKTIRTFAELLQVEIAFFNYEGVLVASTEEYQVQKKDRVYLPFFQKQNKEAVSFVKDPGHMKMCKGCHFQSNCPSKAEILIKITKNDNHYGFLSFVSFTSEGQEKLIAQQDQFKYWLTQLSEIILTILDGSGEFKYTGRNSKENINYIIGNNTQLKKLKELLSRIANSTSSIVITGETGTGKSLLAKFIHEQSMLRKGEFIEINCASIPETLFESELFGYEEGAFTGANKKGKPGYFELADRGTLFLDEVADLPVHLQPKLLKVLQDGMVNRVGGINPKKVNIRVIAATNQPLEEMMEAKKFRSDLYYRLNVIPIHLPALRERKEDIDTLVPILIDRLQNRTGKFIQTCSNEYLKRLQQYHWPGNIRELENVIEYSMNMERGHQLTESSLPDYLNPTLLQPPKKLNEKNDLKDMEKYGIIQALNRYGFDFEGKKLVAEQLGISVRTLYRKIEKYNISVPVR
ncbi:sigma-54 interaction domain-containing protein [Viridibacillus arvi]|uniref:sigma-54 interaction domain-containing protein n=1 Tax=Viridibacillus arvi TaxID=263475 RepID=UPI0036EECA32